MDDQPQDNKPIPKFAIVIALLIVLSFFLGELTFIALPILLYAWALYQEYQRDRNPAMEDYLRRAKSRQKRRLEGKPLPGDEIAPARPHTPAPPIAAADVTDALLETKRARLEWQQYHAYQPEPAAAPVEYTHADIGRYTVGEDGELIEMEDQDSSEAQLDE